MKGIGCYVWDTPEIVRAKNSYELQSDVSVFGLLRQNESMEFIK